MASRLTKACLARMTGFPAVVAFLEQLAGARRQRFGRMIGEEDAERVVVVHRHPGVAAQVGKFRLRRHQRIERHHELVDAPIELLVAELPLRRDAHAKILPDAFEGRPQVALGEPFVDLALGVDPAVQNGRMRGIDFAFQRLQPVAFLHAHRDLRRSPPEPDSIRRSAAAAARPSPDPYRPRPCRCVPGTDRR